MIDYEKKNGFNTFTFYKKYITSNVVYEYEIILENNDIDDISTLGGNLINRYYPSYTLKLETDVLSEFYNIPDLFKRLPFNLDTNMTFRTLNNKNLLFRISGNVYSLIIEDTTTYEEDTLTILATTDNELSEKIVIVD